jgi:hypothetical protein
MPTSPPRRSTLIVALVLWIVGLLDLLSVVGLPYHAGPWALAASGALLLVASQVRGL